MGITNARWPGTTTRETFLGSLTGAGGAPERAGGARVVGLLSRFGPRWIAGVLFALVVSFVVIRILLQKEAPDPPKTEDIKVTVAMREFSNELYDLLEEYRSAAPEAGTVGRAEFTRWIERDFHPRANETRQRLMDTELPAGEHGALLAAADRMAALSHPWSEDRVKSAVAALREAARAVERYIGGVDLPNPILPGPIPMSEGQD